MESEQSGGMNTDAWRPGLRLVRKILIDAIEISRLSHFATRLCKVSAIVP